MTRRQALMARALEDVQEIRSDKALSEAYGRLCHKLPMLVQTNGLAQTVAFLGDKAKKSESVNGQAHRLTLDHLAGVLELADVKTLPGFISSMPLAQYMHGTRRVLLAWSFYKRFAVSILGVESGDGNEELG